MRCAVIAASSFEVIARLDARSCGTTPAIGKSSNVTASSRFCFCGGFGRCGAAASGVSTTIRSTRRLFMHLPLCHPLLAEIVDLVFLHVSVVFLERAG